MKTNKSDKRIYNILNGANNILKTIDPQGLFSQGFIQSVRLKDKDDIILWTLSIVFPTGDISNLTGMSNLKENILNDLVLCTAFQNIVIPLRDENTFDKALPPFEKLPLQMTRNISSPTSAQIGTLDSSPVWDYKELCRNALFAGIEDDRRNYESKRFNTIEILYRKQPMNDLPSSCEICSAYVTKTAMIKMETSVTYEGLRQKKITLTYNVDKERSFKATCTRTKEQTVIPSLKLAFDLIDMLDRPNPDERKHIVTIDKPKAQITL